MELILITNEVDLAVAAVAAGVERVMIDLERRGKAERQEGVPLFLSDHAMSDLTRLRRALTEREATAQIQVRVDPWHAGSPTQIDQVVELGADVVMLPMTETPEQAQSFTGTLAGRARASLLVETVDGIRQLDDLLAAGDVAEVHIGLNDLRLSSGGRVIFEPLADTRLTAVAGTVHRHGLGLGIGGVTAPDVAGLPVDPDLVLGALVRLGATTGWLGRSFRAGLSGPRGVDAARVAHRVTSLRAALARWERATPEEHEEGQERLRAAVDRWATEVAHAAAEPDP